MNTNPKLNVYPFPFFVVASLAKMRREGSSGNNLPEGLIVSDGHELSEARRTSNIDYEVTLPCFEQNESASINPQMKTW